MVLQVSMPIPADRDVIVGALEGLVRSNVAIMRRLAEEGITLPSVFSAGVRFRREPSGQEDWQTIDRMFESREADCEDIASGYAAQLRLRGEESAFVDVVPIDNAGNFHAVVRRASGAVEDPSAVIIDQETNMHRKPKIRVQGVEHHTVGSIDLPLKNGNCISAQAVGFDPADALRRVVDAVIDVSNNPAVYAMLPPQASAALLAIHGINEMTDGALKQLKKDDRAKESEKKLAEIVLKARQEKRETPTASLWDTWVKGSTPSMAGVVGLSSVTLRDHRGGAISPISKAPGARDARAQPSGLPPPAAPPGAYGDRPAATPAPNVPDPNAPIPGSFDPTGQFVFVGPTSTTPGHWERPSGYNTPPQPYPGAPSPPQGPQYPGAPPYNPYGPQYPPYGAPPYNPYGPQYPPPMPPMPYNPYGGYPQDPYGSPYGSPYGYPQDPMIAYYQAMQQGWYGQQQVVPWDPSQIQQQPLTVDEAAAIALWGSNAFAEGAFPGYT